MYRVEPSKKQDCISLNLVLQPQSSLMQGRMIGHLIALGQWHMTSGTLPHSQGMNTTPKRSCTPTSLEM